MSNLQGAIAGNLGPLGDSEPAAAGGGSSWTPFDIVEDVNGDPMDPRPGLLLYTEVAGSPVTFPFWGERHAKQVALRGPQDDPDPGVDSLFSIKEIHLTIDRRAVRRNGRRIPFVGLPTTCAGKWIVTATSDPYNGDPLTAKHKVRCTEA